MLIPIPIPIGINHVATVQGAVWKFVSCSHCQQSYAYLLELEATGEDHDPIFVDWEGASKRARLKAEQNLVQKGRNVVLPVPCPNCGYYQDDMSRKLKDEASINRLQIAGASIAGLSLLPLASSIPHVWVITPILAVAGLALLAYGYVVAFCFDPNAGDPEPRKVLGRRHAVWGQQLVGLLAAESKAEHFEGLPSSRGHSESVEN
jgi:hypothetical protein